MDSFLPQKLLQKGLVWLKSRHWARNSISPRYALVEAALIGVFGALAALLLKQGIGWLGGMRINLVNQWGAIAVLPLSGLFFGALAGLLLEYVAPTAGGGRGSPSKSLPCSLCGAIISQDSLGKKLSVQS